MYTLTKPSTSGETYRLLDFSWINLGAGRDENGDFVQHPHELWLRTCNGELCDEWWMEKPTRVCLPKSMKYTGIKSLRHMTILEWFEQRNKELVPISDPSFRSYEGQCYISVKKRRDLHTMSQFLCNANQDILDRLYPEPTTSSSEDEMESN